MDNRVRIAKEVPPPPTITPEISKRLIEEGKQMAREIAEQARSMHQLTEEDWRTIIK